MSVSGPLLAKGKGAVAVYIEDVDHSFLPSAALGGTPATQPACMSAIACHALAETSQHNPQRKPRYWLVDIDPVHALNLSPWMPCQRLRTVLIALHAEHDPFRPLHTHLEPYIVAPFNHLIPALDEADLLLVQCLPSPPLSRGSLTDKSGQTPCHRIIPVQYASFLSHTMFSSQRHVCGNTNQRGLSDDVILVHAPEISLLQPASSSLLCDHRTRPHLVHPHAL